jgi:hypothetical protein
MGYAYLHDQRLRMDASSVRYLRSEALPSLLVPYARFTTFLEDLRKRQRMDNR